MQKGDVLLVDYTGRDLTTGNVFETTLEEKAKAEKLFDPRITYKPVPVILGRHEMLAALEDEMEKMKEGETRKIVLEPKQAFGERDANHIRVAAAKDFHTHKLVPHTGMIVDVNGAQGRVQSVSGGRVRIDFNHPLAGKQLEYEIVIRQKLVSLLAQSSALFDAFFPFVAESEKKISEKNGEILVQLPAKAREIRQIDVLKKAYSEVLTKHLKGVLSVEFVENTPTTPTPAATTAVPDAPKDPATPQPRV